MSQAARSNSADAGAKRILHIIDTFDPAAGGPPEAVRLLVRGYKAIGADVEVVCLDLPEQPFLRAIDCTVHALGESYLGRYAVSLRLWRWLMANIGRFDGVVMNGIWTFPGVALWLAARRNGTRYGIFTHGALDPWFNRRYRLKYAKKLLYWPLQYAVLRGAEAVFFTTEAERDLATTSFKPNRWRSVVVPYGIMDPEQTAPDRDRQAEAFFARLPVLKGRRYLLFLARIHEKKGCDLLLEAFARLAPSFPDVDLVMAGPDQAGLKAGLMAAARQQGIADRVHWPGMLSGDAKWGALRACEALALPSHQENFGLSVVEALAVGRPVLISNQVNIWPAIEADGAGLVEEDTECGATALLRRWLGMSAEEREAMSERARACFLRRFTMDRAATAINALFIPHRIRQPEQQTEAADPGGCTTGEATLAHHRRVPGSFSAAHRRDGKKAV